MIFLDSNVPMYLVGAEHPNKDQCARTLHELVVTEQRLVTSIEVFQEIVHRYAAVRRPDAIGPAVALLESVCETVLAFGLPEIHVATSIVRSADHISARDALHVAVMRTHGITRILSYDTGFDQFDDIQRLY